MAEAAPWVDLTNKQFEPVHNLHSHHSTNLNWKCHDQFLRTIGRTIIKMIISNNIIAMQVHFRVFFWCFLAIVNCWTPPLTYELARATWLSMSSSCSPWDWTSTAMSMKTWCSSLRCLSISFTESCLSWISWIVSIMVALPCCWMAFCKNVSLSPVIKFTPLLISNFTNFTLVIVS